MPIWDNVGGVYHKAKPYSNIGGVWVPDKKTYDNIAGVWRQGYSAAIEWTRTVSTRGRVDSYSDSPDRTVIVSFSTGSSGDDREIQLTFTFSSPIRLPASAAFHLLYVSTLGTASPSVYVNGNSVYFAGTNTNVNLSTDTDVTTITARIQSYTKSNINAELCLTLNPIGVPSFVLNSAGIVNI